MDVTEPKQYDTTNAQVVGSNGNDIIVMMPKNRMTKQEALMHAAFLVAMADDHNEFDAILKAVQNT